MIRKLQTTDIDSIADIWLDTNIKAHDFISEQYWLKNYNIVKEMFAQAEIYVYEDARTPLGFIGLDHDYIAGLFVRDGAQSGGIGKQLLDFVKDKKQKLNLSVYQKNTRAVRFYKREKFRIQSEQTEEETCEKEYFMEWVK